MKKTSKKDTAMKMIFLIIFIVITTTINAQTDTCRICGNWKWEKNDAQTFFTLKIKLKNNVLFGRHCYTLNNGSKVDCASLPADTTFKIVKYSYSDSIDVDIKSSFSGNYGKAKIYLMKDKLVWELIKKPEGEYYFPEKAILIR